MFETSPMSNKMGKKPTKKARNLNRNEKAQSFKDTVVQRQLISTFIEFVGNRQQLRLTI